MVGIAFGLMEVLHLNTENLPTSPYFLVVLTYFEGSLAHGY